uniref:Protein kinase domain-containing protein n=1 Tax=Phytophthora ramorum TaxID=164328 RepID=H3GIU6_PHYRM
MAASPKRCRMLAAVAIVTFIYAAMEACVAQDSSTGSLSADNSSSGSWTSSTGSEVGFVPTTTRAEVLAQEWFIVNLFDNETHLAFGVDSKLKNLTDSDIICNGMPSLQRRSAELLPNFGCPDIFTAVDASCTCLGDGYTDSDVWEFRVARRTIRSEYPTALSSADVLPVDAIRTMQVPSTLKTLEITNINMFSITLAASSFLPPTTTNLNLTNNSLTTFPTVVFNVDNLQELYIAQNDITDFNISNASFNAIKSLTAFESDQPDVAATCLTGTWQTAHNSRFCVASSTVGTPARTRRGDFSPSPVSSPSSYYLDRSAGDSINLDESSRDTAEALLEDPIIVANRINYKDVKIGKCLSRGGFGLVFVGEYKGRQVAVKRIRPDRNQDPKDVKAFIKEIALMAELHHPRIVEFVGVAWDNLRHISAVSEFMESGDLRHVLRGFKRQGNPLSWRNHKTSISLHIAEAMEYLHAHSPKVIHRDLKSKNVLLNMHLEAKLTDFGVSRTQYTVQTHAMTAGIGTSFWIAPEVLLGRDYDEQADIYSFGVVLSEIDTDDYPYWNDANRDAARGKLQEADILRQVASGTKRPQFSSTCPAGILLLAEKCLQKKPDDRPTASEIVETLQQLLRSSLLPSSSDSSPSFVSGSGWTVS